MNKDHYPKGRLIIIGGSTPDTCLEGELEPDINKIPSQLFKLLPEHKNIRIEMIISDYKPGYKEKYSAALERHGYINSGIIHAHQENNFNDYDARISQAGIVFIANEDPEICEMLKKSEILKLLHKKYIHEEDFTIIGMNAASMYIPKILVNEKGIHQGFGFINNCIIDTKFEYKTRFKKLIRAIMLHPECLGIGLNSGMLMVIEKGCKASCYGSSTVMAVDARYINKSKAGKGTTVFMKNLRGHILTEGSGINLCTGNLIKDNQFHNSLNFTHRNTIQ
ncbi:hypothetical protein OWR28_12970 [Chryseobacterium sp. 1B4]